MHIVNNVYEQCLKRIWCTRCPKMAVGCPWCFGRQKQLHNRGVQTLLWWICIIFIYIMFIYPYVYLSIYLFIEYCTGSLLHHTWTKRVQLFSWWRPTSRNALIYLWHLCCMNCSKSFFVIYLSINLFYIIIYSIYDIYNYIYIWATKMISCLALRLCIYNSIRWNQSLQLHTANGNSTM